MSNEKTDDTLILIVAEERGGRWVRKDAGAIRRTLNDAYKNVRDVGRGMRVSPGRWISEKVFSGFGEKMEQLREVDNQIKLWTDDLDNCLDRAHDANKAGRPLDVIFWISQINNRLGLVGEKYKQLNDVHEKDLADFYSDVEKDDEGKRKFKYDDGDYFTGGEGKIVQAGMLDQLGRRITNWKMQQMYREKIAKRKKSIEKLITLSELLVQKVESRLSLMSKARSSGDIARYMAALTDVSKMQQIFEKTFRKEFDENFSSLMDVLKKREAELVKEDDEKSMGPNTVVDPELANQPVVDLNAPNEDVMRELDKNKPREMDPRFQAVEKNTGDVEPVNSYHTPVPGRMPPLPLDETETKHFRAEPGALETPAPQAASPLNQLDSPFEPNNGEIADPEMLSQELQGPIQQIEVIAPKAAPRPKARGKKKTQEPTLVSPPETEDQKEGPTTQRSAAMQALLLKKSHLEFYGELEKAAKLEDPYLLAAMLSKYSEQIEQQDVDTSDELLTLAETIVNV